MAENLTCTSCNIKITNQAGSVTFKCPKCGDYEIVRCRHCRKILAKYTCPSCSFTAPN